MANKRVHDPERDSDSNNSHGDRSAADDIVTGRGKQVKPGFHIICNGRRRSAITVGDRLHAN